MAIKAPAWCANAVPTALGWQDPQSGELYVSARFTQEQLDEFNGWIVPQPEVLTEVPRNDFEKTPQMLTEAPVGNKSLDEMTKLELEALSRQHGVELDRRESKQTLLEKTRNILKGW